MYWFMPVLLSVTTIVRALRVLKKYWCLQKKIINNTSCNQIIQVQENKTISCFLWQMKMRSKTILRVGLCLKPFLLLPFFTLSFLIIPVTVQTTRTAFTNYPSLPALANTLSSGHYVFNWHCPVTRFAISVSNGCILYISL